MTPHPFEPGEGWDGKYEPWYRTAFGANPPQPGRALTPEIPHL